MTRKERNEEIRRLYRRRKREGWTYEALACEFGLSVSSIKTIVRGYFDSRRLYPRRFTIRWDGREVTLCGKY